MIYYWAYPIFLAGISVLICRLCKWRVGRYFGWWFASSVLFGLLGYFIPWHSATGFHYGFGSPIPFVIFERIESGSYIDFPVLAAFVVNPIAVFVIGSACWCVVFFTRRFWLRHDDAA